MTAPRRVDQIGAAATATSSLHSVNWLCAPKRIMPNHQNRKTPPKVMDHRASTAPGVSARTRRTNASARRPCLMEAALGAARAQVAG